MEVKFSDEDVVELKAKAQEFVKADKFSAFMKWMDEAVESDEPALLSSNPPNHVYDLEDGTMDLAVGGRLVALKRQQCQHQEKTIFSFKILKEGSFREVLASLRDMQNLEAKQEAAMAFYVRALGEYVSSSLQWQELSRRFGRNMPEKVDNPFYREICEIILNRFQGRGWI
jgi:hypothetical protein